MYGVAADVSISDLFIAGVIPGILLAALFSGCIVVWSLLHPGQIPPRDAQMTFAEKIKESGSLIPVVLLISAVLGSMSWATFKEALMGTTRLYCMIAMVLAGASFLILAMGYIGLPRHLTEWITSLGLSQFGLIMVLIYFVPGIVTWLPMQMKG